MRILILMNGLSSKSCEDREIIFNLMKLTELRINMITSFANDMI